MAPLRRKGIYGINITERKIGNIRRNPELNGLFSRLTAIEGKSDAEAIEIVSRIAKEKGIKW